MRKRVGKWMLLFTLGSGTLFVSCPASVAVKVLDSMMAGVYSGAQAWATGAVIDLLEEFQGGE